MTEVAAQVAPHRVQLRERPVLARERVLALKDQPGDDGALGRECRREHIDATAVRQRVARVNSRRALLELGLDQTLVDLVVAQRGPKEFESLPPPPGRATRAPLEELAAPFGPAMAAKSASTAAVIEVLLALGACEAAANNAIRKVHAVSRGAIRWTNGRR